MFTWLHHYYLSHSPHNNSSRQKSPQRGQASTAIPEISVPLMEEKDPEADNSKHV